MTSDSVNLGSNPSSPAITSIDISEAFRRPSGSERSDFSERTAHIGRTQPGTLMPPDQIVALRRELTPARNALNAETHFAKQQGLTNLINRLDLMLKEPDRDELHDGFWRLAAAFVRLNA